MKNKLIKARNAGFSLMELMITLAIVGIIAAIAIPSYMDYTKKAHYSEIVRSTGPYVVGVSECYHRTGSFSGCNGGIDGVPSDIQSTTENIASITVKDGQITVVPVKEHGISHKDTYILTPIEKDHIISWESSGGGVKKGLAR